MRYLLQKGMPGVDADFIARGSAKCYPNSRRSIRRRIRRWLLGEADVSRLFWVWGPAGVGKSAIAQSIADDCKSARRLGAVVFLSGLGGHNDPNRIIPSLVYQLAVLHPHYKRILTQRLDDDPQLLDRGHMETQFKALIIEPVQSIWELHKLTFPEDSSLDPLVIILDGVDECRDHPDAQGQLMNLIGAHAKEAKDFPLLWLVCSRPERHLKRLVETGPMKLYCEELEIRSDSEEAQADVAFFLESRLRNIRLAHSDVLEENWPSPEHLRRVKHMASGHFAAASAIIRFINDSQYSDPNGQLEELLMGGHDTSDHRDALAPLDNLYRRILSTVPSDIVPTTLRIIAFSTTGLPAQDIAIFLGMNRSSFFGALSHLHSVLSIPSPRDARWRAIFYHHISFQEFLLDPPRARDFHFDFTQLSYDFALCGLRTLKCSVPEVQAGETSFVLSIFSPVLTFYIDVTALPALHDWIRDRWTRADAIQFLNDHLSYWTLLACSSIPKEATSHVSQLVAELERFNFDHLPNMDQIYPFLMWLFSLVRPQIV